MCCNCKVFSLRGCCALGGGGGNSSNAGVGYSADGGSCKSGCGDMVGHCGNLGDVRGELKDSGWALDNGVVVWEVV